MKINKYDFLAGLIITASVVVGIFSVKDDSLTSDEASHIPSGYSYLTQKDMRINPEHPPLIKDLAALPLLFQKINFDTEHPSWKTNVNEQWSFGPHFLYEIGNDPDKIAFTARLTMMIIFVLLAFLVYKWGRERYGEKAGLIALALTALSPNIIAHAHYVTTDVGAALGFILATYFFIKFVDKPNKNNLIYAGLTFGLAQLLKFSLVLLIPLYIFTLIVFYFVKPRRFNMMQFFGSLLAIFTIGYLLVWPVYQYHVWNYPPERQKSDTSFILNSFPIKTPAKAVVWLADKPILRPYAEYLLGVLMVFQRAGGGNTTYFMGEVSTTAWKSYFPMVYILKEPIPILLLILTALATSVLLRNLIKKSSWSLKNLKEWIKNNFTEFVWLSFIVLYWTLSIKSNLNIGLRHVLPTFPFIYLLVSGRIAGWLDNKKGVFDGSSKKFILAILLLWLIREDAMVYPNYLAYFNQLSGGPANGYKYAVDSNLDWGQDLKRLAMFVKKNNIDKIKLDYFGGGKPEYYLGNKYERLENSNPNQRHGWVAISTTFMQNGRSIGVKGYKENTTFYRWLDNYEPVAKIGYSIFVYKID